MSRIAILAIMLASFTISAQAKESRSFDSDGVSLRFFIAGDGPTVVLLHGFSGSAEGLYISPGTFDALVDAGFRVVALDQRGHAGSDKPHRADAYGLNMVEDVRRLLDHLNVSRTHLIGYSMGAKVSNSFRQAYPERLMSITLGGYGWPWRSAEFSLSDARRRLDTRPVLPGNDLDALAAVSVGMADLHSSEESLRTNEVPAFAIIGDKDEVVPGDDFAELSSTMSNLSTTVIPGTHAGPDGAPYKPVFADKLIGFLKSL